MIRQAIKKDASRIAELLFQIHDVHVQARPDLFKKGARKYDEQQVEEIIKSSQYFCCVYVNDKELILGYAICKLQSVQNDNSLIDRKTLYIDDLCVDSLHRSQKIGEQLYHYLIEYAKTIGCTNLTLNVWNANQRALSFYESLGLLPMVTTLEKRL